MKKYEPYLMHNKKGNPATNYVSTALTLETLFEIFSPKCAIPGKVSKLEQKAAEGSVNPQFQSGSECDSFWQSSHWTTSILPLSLNDAEQGFTKRGNYLNEQMRVMRFLSHEMRLWSYNGTCLLKLQSDYNWSPQYHQTTHKHPVIL